MPAAEAHLAHCAVCQRAVAELALGTGATLDSGDSHDLDAPVESNAVAVAKERPPADIPHSGTLIDQRYRVERMLGRGGMGSVVAATHVGLQQRVAMKVLRLLGSQAVARFMREGRMLAQLNNRHIVRVFDSGQLANGLPYIVMEYLDGADLARLMRQGPIPMRVTVSYVRQACAALEAAHAAGIIHRDLKPSNLFLANQDSGPIIKVLDFGISKSLRDPSGLDDALTLTGTGDLIGSPRYMSPEQLQGLREIDLRTDIWSLGVILYELLTGSPPFPQRDLASIAIAVAMRPPQPPRELRSEIPSGLEAVVMRCLERDPVQRFASVAALSAALAPFEMDLPVAVADTLATGSTSSMRPQSVTLATTTSTKRAGSLARLSVAGLVVVAAGAGLRWVIPSERDARESPATETSHSPVGTSKLDVAAVKPPPLSAADAGAPLPASQGARTEEASAMQRTAAIPAAPLDKSTPEPTGAPASAAKAVLAPKPKPKPKPVPQVVAPVPIAPAPGLTGLSETPD